MPRVDDYRADALWIVRENLRKTRLADPARYARLQGTVPST